MAKFTVVAEGVPDYIKEQANTTFLDLAKKLAPKVQGPMGIKAEQNQWLVGVERAGTGNSWRVTIRGPGVTIRRVYHADQKILEHSYFELKGALQGQGLADDVMQASVKFLDKVKATKIALHANLDVGGYAWLRKGFFPGDQYDLIDAVVYHLGSTSDPLFQEFRSIISKMTPRKAKEFVLTEEFRKYKKLLLGADWRGNADISRPEVRKALLGKAGEAERMVKRQIGKPQTANEQILDNLVRHQTYVMRLSHGLSKEAILKVQAGERAVKDIILKYAELMEGVSPVSKKGQKLLKEMTAEIEGVRSGLWKEIGKTAENDAVEYGKVENRATIKAIESPFPVTLGIQPLSVPQIRAIALAMPFEGRTLAEWVARAGVTDTARITANAKIGIMNGETPTQVARRVFGSAENAYRDGVYHRSFKDLESIYLTVTNGINNQVKQQLYAENADIIDLELYVATLDIRTTLECAGNDGKTYPNGEGPVPPLHFRCRSLRVPYINPENLRKRGFDASYDKMLLREYAEANKLKNIRSYSDLPRGYKTAYNNFRRQRVRELVGQVPATQNFEQFLRNQSVEFQNEYLGPGKAAIFRQGKLPLDRFVTRDGYELTIEQLNKLAS